MITSRFKFKLAADAAYIIAILAVVFLIVGSVGALELGNIGLLQCAGQMIAGMLIAYTATIAGLWADQRAFEVKK